jgi:hypothetical protein
VNAVQDSERPDVIEMTSDVAAGSTGNLLKTPIRGHGRLAIVAAAAAVLVVVAAVATFAALRPVSAPNANPALAKLIAEVTTAPISGGKSAYFGYPAGTFPQPVSGPALMRDNKPEVFYVGAEYCPYCGAQNWALIVALSRFGTFSGLNTVRTHPYLGIAPVDGWTFYGSTYTSKYLAFVPVERYSDVLAHPNGNPDDASSYRALQQLTPAQHAVFDKYDNSHAVPFIDFAGQFVLVGASVDVGLLAGKTWSQIAGALRDARTPAAQAVLGAANSLTAQLCQLTGSKPAAVCEAVSSLVVGN